MTKGIRRLDLRGKHRYRLRIETDWGPITLDWRDTEVNAFSFWPDGRRDVVLVSTESDPNPPTIYVRVTEAGVPIEDYEVREDGTVRDHLR